MQLCKVEYHQFFLKPNTNTADTVLVFRVWKKEFEANRIKKMFIALNRKENCRDSELLNLLFCTF